MSEEELDDEDYRGTTQGSQLAGNNELWNNMGNGSPGALENNVNVTLFSISIHNISNLSWRGDAMFEQDHKIVESLLDKDKNFRRLFNKHCQLKSKVREANEGYLGISDFDLEVLKKEKLLLKDRMSVIIEDYRHTQI